MALVKNIRHGAPALVTLLVLAACGSTSVPSGEQPAREQTALDITLVAGDGRHLRGGADQARVGQCDALAGARCGARILCRPGHR